ncbi:24937_t:CDS:10, partial [Dentiscutata erythropus]
LGILTQSNSDAYRYAENPNGSCVGYQDYDSWLLSYGMSPPFDLYTTTGHQTAPQLLNQGEMENWDLVIPILNLQYQNYSQQFLQGHQHQTITAQTPNVDMSQGQQTLVNPNRENNSLPRNPSIIATPVEKFTLDIKFCYPYSGISQFFAKTWLIKWSSVDLFTRFIYKVNPIITPQQVFDIYYKNLSDIIAIKHIDNDVIQYVHDIVDKRIQKESCLKVIGDALLHIRRLRARVRAINTNKTQLDFQRAEQNDQINKRFDVYANSNNGIDQSPSEQQSENNTEFGLFTEDNDILEPNQFLNINTMEIGTSSQTNNINQFTIDTENRINDVIKDLLPHKDLEEIWKLVMSRLNEKNIKVQSIESRIVDLTNWSSVEWSRILKTEDKANLFRFCRQKLLNDQIDKNVINLIDNSEINILKDKLLNIGSEDGNLSAEIVSFFHKCFRREINILSHPIRERDYIIKILSPILTDLLEEYDSGLFQTYWIEKISKAVQTRKRRKIHAEYVKFGNESIKMDVVVELRNYGIELVSVEVGNTEVDNDDLKLREDHTALKMELKDMLDNFRDELHFKKKDIAEIFVMGIQITEVATLVLPKSLSAMEYLLRPFIKNLLGFRHTLLMLNEKIAKKAITRQSTPSPASSPLPQTSEPPEINRVKEDVFTILDKIY